VKRQGGSVEEGSGGVAYSTLEMNEEEILFYVSEDYQTPKPYKVGGITNHKFR
jgi:hypothetical protein